MARVNHKRVKQLLNEKRSRITDRQFFTSRILAGHFEDMAMAQTRRYKYNRRIHVAISWSPKSGEVACTNNLSVLINAGHRLVTQNRGRENRYEIVCGLFAHELGHCLYTDFLAGQTYNNYLSREKWYPEPPAYKLPKDTVNERALWEYVRLESRNNEMLRYVAHHISNVIEDAYIENYRDLILENIEYDYLCREFATYREDLDEIVELMVETVCARRKTTRIAGSDFPHEVVRSRFLKLDSEHIRFVMDSLQKNTTEVRNMKQYLLTVLFNAPTTISNHYTSQVNHDMNAGGW